MSDDDLSWLSQVPDTAKDIIQRGIRAGMVEGVFAGDESYPKAIYATIAGKRWADDDEDDADEDDRCPFCGWDFDDPCDCEETIDMITIGERT